MITMNFLSSCQCVLDNTVQRQGSLCRGSGSVTASTAMAVPILKGKVGVANVKAIKRARHSLSWACAVCTFEKGLASCRAISMAGRALAASQLDVDATDLPECLHQPGPDFSFPKHSYGKKTIV